MTVPSYRAGDFWRICEICGFQKRSSETFKRWDGLYVCSEDYETRHPQDFVRGQVDRQNVPDPRPEPVASFVGPLTTTIETAASIGATTLTVALTTRWFPTDAIGIMLNSGEVYRAIVVSVPDSTTLGLTAPIPGSAAIGNIVINYSAVSEPTF